jgi:agmatinase
MLSFFCYKQSMENRLIFGEKSTPYREADIALLPVPYEGTVTYGKGTSSGPKGVIDASFNAEMFDMVTGRNYSDLKITVLPMLDVEGDPETVMMGVEKGIGKILSDGLLPFMAGGEHSITAPGVRAVARFHSEKGVGVVQIDAHADLRNEYSGTIHSHAAVMRRVREIAPAIQLGIRSCSIEESELITNENLAVLSPATALEEENLASALETLPEKIYLTVDVDALDPSIMPSTGTPEPGGFSWEEINRLIDSIAGQKEIVGADIVELAPIPGLIAPDYTAARLAYNMMWHMCRHKNGEGK